MIIDDAVAFCGSCDIGPDRWDTPEHLNPDPRRAKTSRGTPCYDCRHEVMAMVDGPPARTLGDLFRERWERATGDRLSVLSPSAVDIWPEHVAPDFRDVDVGISRTQALWKAFPERREGETAMLAAIAGAQRTLYFENQYFTSPIVAEALAQRLEEADGPEVILISTGHSPSWFDQMTMDKTRSAFLKRLEAADRFGRLRAFSPVTADGQIIIVHAKLAIIDDRFIRLGSSNLNNRSEGFDSECDLTLDARAAGNGGGVSCVRVFRNRLLAHWLGCKDQDVERATADGVVAGLDALIASGRNRLRPLRSQSLGFAAAFIAQYHLGDPISAADSLRPWRRRAQMRAKLSAAVQRLKRVDADAPAVPDVVALD